MLESLLNWKWKVFLKTVCYGHMWFVLPWYKMFCKLKFLSNDLVIYITIFFRNCANSCHRLLLDVFFFLQNRWVQEKKTKIWVIKSTNLHPPLDLSICHTIKRQCISISVHCCNILILRRWKELLFTEKRTQKQQTFWTYLCYQIVANIRSRWDIILILIGNITNPWQEAFIEVSVNWAMQFYVKICWTHCGMLQKTNTHKSLEKH